jgi:hypothetical protein
MRQKTLFELLIGGFFGHFRQRFHQLLLGIVDVLHLMHEQIVHGLNVFGKKSHCADPWLMEHTRAKAFTPGRRYVRWLVQR